MTNKFVAPAVQIGQTYKDTNRKYTNRTLKVIDIYHYENTAKVETVSNGGFLKKTTVIDIARLQRPKNYRLVSGKGFTKNLYANVAVRPQFTREALSGSRHPSSAPRMTHIPAPQNNAQETKTSEVVPTHPEHQTVA